MKFLVGTVFLLSFFGISFSLMCYVCNSKTDHACNDPFRGHGSDTIKNEFLKNCNETQPEGLENPEPHCRKVQTWVESANRQMFRVQRECGYTKRKGSDDYVKREEDYQIYAYQCSTDGCNTASHATAFTTALLLVPCFIYRYI